MMQIHVTKHSDNTKMHGFQSVGTTSLCNPICQMRKKVCGGVCEKCYADALCKFRGTLNKNLTENFQNLTSRLMTKQEAALVPVTTAYARIESFGDVANVIQARNYIRIIRAHKATRFGIWSKNDGIWHAAFLAEGKPRNCTYVHSSMELNHVDMVKPMMDRFTDHVFTVWTKDKYPEFEGGKTECAGIRCINCLKCYKKGTSFEINERLR